MCRQHKWTGTGSAAQKRDEITGCSLTSLHGIRPASTPKENHEPQTRSFSLRPGTRRRFPHGLWRGVHDPNARRRRSCHDSDPGPGSEHRRTRSRDHHPHTYGEDLRRLRRHDHEGTAAGNAADAQAGIGMATFSGIRPGETRTVKLGYGIPAAGFADVRMVVQPPKFDATPPVIFKGAVKTR